MQMRSPALMNTEERHREVANILALGIFTPTFKATYWKT